MKSSDTVHLYRGPSSWSLLPTMDSSWRVTREVIYGQETLATSVIFVNKNSSEHFFFLFIINTQSQITIFPYFFGKSPLVSHWFSHSPAASKPRNACTFLLLHFQQSQWGTQANPFILHIKSYPGVVIRARKVLGGIDNRHELNIFRISSWQPGHTLFLFHLRTFSWISTLEVGFSCVSSYYILKRCRVSLYYS